ncbi:fumarylacetoacetate hydrolase family protein [Alkalimonas collagenimarina]|uniref:Fumarylacetoacetate hydrolase family protein n=1 Tax=Alkalimonas collagenimarina TaxID=400390 RepID=A0ABT9GVE0_9GAMM|nr:fumarylacetoacetate hydrolase family protein [Alkalimonas collagenimarina]MDP4535021.1 fumarylacetoacetate hydrolase family protein [Alkalimonas collagenimarina]
MKLATLNNGHRDGQLVVVSRDLQHCVTIPQIAMTLQQLLDDWQQKAPQAEEIYQALNAGDVADAVAFEQQHCESPLPRAFHWADGSAYVNHVELVRKARNAEMPPSFWTDPLMYQGGSDAFIGPCAPIEVSSEDFGIDFEGEIAVITDDVAMGISAEKARERIRLVMLVNDVSLRGLIPNELGKGFGFYQSKPSSSFSPVAVTLDELSDHWNDARLHLPLLSTYNDVAFGKPNAGIDMTFDFGQLIAHAARTRPLGTGTIIGSGTVSNKQGTEYGTAISEGGVGYSCIAEIRMIETIRDGKPSTSFMRFGDRIRIEMLDPQGQSIFGAIDQQVVEYSYKA